MKFSKLWYIFGYMVAIWAEDKDISQCDINKGKTTMPIFKYFATLPDVILK